MNLYEAVGKFSVSGSDSPFRVVDSVFEPTLKERVIFVGSFASDNVVNEVAVNMVELGISGDFFLYGLWFIVGRSEGYASLGEIYYYNRDK